MIDRYNHLLYSILSQQFSSHILVFWAHINNNFSHTLMVTDDVFLHEFHNIFSSCISNHASLYSPQKILSNHNQMVFTFAFRQQDTINVNLFSEMRPAFSEKFSIILWHWLPCTNSHLTLRVHWSFQALLNFLLHLILSPTFYLHRITHFRLQYTKPFSVSLSLLQTPYYSCTTHRSKSRLPHPSSATSLLHFCVLSLTLVKYNSSNSLSRSTPSRKL